MRCAQFLLLLMLTGCAAKPQPVPDNWAKESIRDMTQAHYIGMQVDCLHLTEAQTKYGLTLTRYQAQRYLATLATTPEAAECQQRALATCEKSAPSLCLAPPDKN